MVQLCEAGSEHEAAIIVALLRDEGIPASGQNHGADVFGGEMDVIVPRRVRVRRQDLDAARTLLRESEELAGRIDWDAVDWLAEDDPDRIDPDAEPVVTADGTGLLVKITAFILILIVLMYLASRVFTPTASDGLIPGGP